MSNNNAENKNDPSFDIEFKLQQRLSESHEQKEKTQVSNEMITQAA